MPGDDLASWRKMRSTGLGCLGVLLWFAVSSAAFRVAYALGERFVIRYAFSSEAYANGLRLVGRRGQLNDGRWLPGGWFAILCAGSFVATSVVTIICVAVLRTYSLWPDDEDGGDEGGLIS